MRISDITDGTSTTYLVGEKYVCPDDYFTGTDSGDDQSALAGDSDDQNRWTAPYAPMMDTPGSINVYTFGCAHAAGFNMALCDGSVHTMNYSIDPLVHQYLGSRNDGQPIDGKKL